MSKKTSLTELSRMTASELRKELQAKRSEMAKMRLGLAMQSEKNSAAYKLLRKEIARMSMALHHAEKNPTAVVEAPKKSVEKKVSTEKPSQAAKKSVKGTGSRSKKS